MPEQEKPPKLAFGDPGCPEYADGRPFVSSDEKIEEEKNEEENDDDVLVISPFE